MVDFVRLNKVRIQLAELANAPEVDENGSPEDRSRWALLQLLATGEVRIECRLDGTLGFGLTDEGVRAAEKLLRKLLKEGG